MFQSCLLSWRRRPTLGPLEVRDGILVIGEEKKQMHVHKEVRIPRIQNHLIFDFLKDKRKLDVSES